VRERLLREATTLFARAGYDGTTVDEVVDAAGVNKRMVYHYFGNKEKLYEAVLGEAYRSLEAVESTVISREPDLEKMTEGIVRMYFDFLRVHPKFVRLLLWENMNEGRVIRRFGLKLTKDPILTALEKFLQDGVAQGRIRADMDARHLLISIIGLCQIYSSNRFTLSQALDLDLGAVAVREQGVRHVTRLLLEGITARG
jgi:TetR/AcrR family transcriptional regulator